MRVSVYLGVSIDGFIAHPDGSFEFLKPFDAENVGYPEFFATVDALVIGRETYDSVRGFDPWPYANKRVIVLTHRPIEPLHGETTYAGALRPLVDRLAAEGVQRIYLDGGNAIHGGLDEDLVDDITVSIVPRTIGAGRPLFGTGGPHLYAWTMTDTCTFPNGIVQVHYERARSASASRLTIGTAP